LYDGDNEPEGGEESGGNDEPEGDPSMLGWAKTKLHLPSPRDTPSSPFEAPPKGATSPLPPDAVDLVVEDPKAVEEARTRARQRGEPQAKVPAHVYRHQDAEAKSKAAIDEVYSPAIPGEQTTTSATIRQEEAPGGDPVEQIERIEERVTAPTPAVRKHNHYDDEDNPWA
jgi:hypothetical protein